RDHAPGSGPPDRRAQVEDPRGAPRRREDRDPAEEEREGPWGHPRGDPEVDQARPGRLDGPGPRRGPSTQAEGPDDRGAAQGRQAERRAQRRARATGERAWSTVLADRAAD